MIRWRNVQNEGIHQDRGIAGAIDGGKDTGLEGRIQGGTILLENPNSDIMVELCDAVTTHLCH
jgi:hypothetical protein